MLRQPLVAAHREEGVRDAAAASTRSATAAYGDFVIRTIAAKAANVKDQTAIGRLRS